MHVAGITVIGKTEVYLRPCLVEGVTVLVGADVRKSGYNITDQPFRSDQGSGNSADTLTFFFMLSVSQYRYHTHVAVHSTSLDAYDDACTRAY